MQINQDKKARKRSEVSDCIYVWDTNKKEMITHKIKEDPFNIECERSSAFALNSEFMHVEKFLKGFQKFRGVIENPSEVRDYLYRHPDILNLASFVCGLVYRNFDSNIQLLIDINDNDEPHSEYLALFLRAPYYDDSVMDRIEKIQNNYFDLLGGMTGWFLFTTDFQLPR